MDERLKRLALERLKGVLKALESGKAVFYEHSYSTDFDKGRYRYIFGIEPAPEVEPPLGFSPTR